MKTRVLALVGLCLLAAVGARAQGFWQKKPYQEWSESECHKLLRDSPWANSYTLGQALFQTVKEESTVPGRDTSPQITYLAQIWSARPVREAMVRQQRLDPKYKQLSAEQKKQLEEKSAKFIETEFSDTVVVQVFYSSTSQSYDRELSQYWQKQSEDSLRQTTYLIGAPGRVSPMHAQVAPGAAREMQFIFPRVVNGQPLVGPKDKELSLELAHPTIGIIPEERVFIRFEVKKLMTGGKPVF
jgi:hypothetical protein